MAVPVWLPKGDISVVAAPLEVVNKAGLSEQLPAAKIPEATSTSVDVASSPAQALVNSLRAGGGAEGMAAEPAQEHAATLPIWLVMPNVDAADRAAAQSLLENILKAVNVDMAQCQLFWQLPSALPPSAVKYLWCFGIQPPQTQATGIVLPAMTEMLSDVNAKRQAWGQLKAAMPFIL